MGNITLNKPSGGQLTISPEDGTSNETVTIPSVGVGKVLQVVRAYTDSNIQTTSGNWTPTGLSIQITPTKADSTIVLQVAGGAGYGSDAAMWSTIYRNGSVNIGDTDYGLERHKGTFYYPHSMLTADTPSSTSPVTYECYFRNGDGASTVTWAYPIYGEISLVAMEVAA